MIDELEGFGREAVVTQSRYYLGNFSGRAEENNERLNLR
jgi:hypothetical protein